MTVAQVWASLTPDEQATAMALLRCSDMRATPTLLTLRHQSRAAGLANREVPGPNARRIEFAGWLHETRRLTDD